MAMTPIPYAQALTAASVVRLIFKARWDSRSAAFPIAGDVIGSLDLYSNRIEHGVLAGNICTHNDPRSDTTGVDCSAFVSAAWGLSTHFTTVAIPSITQPVTDTSDLRPGDAFNKPGSHVMLFLYSRRVIWLR